jgi:phage FluMu protein Com
MLRKNTLQGEPKTPHYPGFSLEIEGVCYIFPAVTSPSREEPMDDHRCPKCNKLLMAMTDRTGRTELRCLKCDQIDPMKTHAARWADSPLAGPTKAA